MLFRQIALSWNSSLRLRLVTLGILPIAVAFPLVIFVLLVIGGYRGDEFLNTHVRGYVAGVHAYLDRAKHDLSGQVERVARSEQLRSMLRNPLSVPARSAQLHAEARSLGLDFLVVIDDSGKVIASSDEQAGAQRVPLTRVVEQAHIGITNAGFERFEITQILALWPGLLSRFQHPLSGVTREPSTIVLTAGAHIPLSTDLPDAIVLGGVLLRGNLALIEHMRHTVFPGGGILHAQDGVIGLFNWDVGMLFSGDATSAEFALGVRVPESVTSKVLISNELVVRKIDFPSGTHLVGFRALLDPADEPIGLVAAGFLVAPYLDLGRVVLNLVAASMLVSMLAISVLFLRAGAQIDERLRVLAAAMDKVRHGDRSIRLQKGEPADEIGRLVLGFNVLLEALQEQDRLRQAALDDLSDEVSMRKALFESERDGVAILLTDASIYDANPRCADLLGFALNDLKRSSFLDRDRDSILSPFLERLSTDAQRDAFFEATLVRRDGGEFLAEISLSKATWRRMTFIVLLARDISARRAVETELDAHRRHLEWLVEVRTRELGYRSDQLNGIFELSPDGFVLFDERRRVAFVNDAFLRMTGLRASDVQQVEESVFSDLLVNRSDIRARFPGMATLALGNGDLVDEHDKRFLGRGRVGHHHAVFELRTPFKRTIEVLFKRSNSSAVAQILYFRDITHEAEIDAMKSEFLATAAHELRTPMASIYGYSELLLHQALDDRSQREMLETIHDQASLVESIVSELLDLARIEARRGKDFVYEDASMNELVRAVTKSFKEPSGREAPCFTPAATDLVVNVDTQKLRQAITNVLSNAYKYSPDGGCVAVDVLHDASDAQGMAGVRVRDHGMGMSPAQVSRIFERFYRVDHSGRIPGSGLGMSIVKEIVEIHGGRIDIDTALGEGMTVTLWVPAVEATAEDESSRRA